MNSSIDDSLHAYKICAGKKCQIQGTHYLKVLYLNKCGWLCDSCKDSLVSNHLVAEEKTTGEVDYE